MKKFENQDINLMKRKKAGVMELRTKGIVKKYVWKNRYFILTERGSILYYSMDLAKKEKSFKGFISLKQSVIKIVDKKKSCFALIDRDREFVLKCSNYEEMKEWVRVIRNEMNHIFDQRRTVFQSFKPISLDPTHITNNRDRNDSIDTFIDENLDEELNYEFSLLENDSSMCINPYFIGEDDENIHDYVNAIENDIQSQSLQYLSEEEGESFEEFMIITTDIIGVINDLNKSNNIVEYSIDPRLNYRTKEELKQKKKKKSESRRSKKY